MQALRLRRLKKNNIILPYFVVEGKNVKESIKSMPGVYHLSIDNLIRDIPTAHGIQSILLFGIPETKDRIGSGAYKKNGVVQRAVRAIKKEFKDLIVITDVCLCGYTSHGHCRIVKGKKFDNDASLKVLAKIALSHAEAGTDFAAPSAMMDGQVGEIRKTLDKNGFKDAGILAYSAKYASNFYGPFRDAMDSAPRFGDRTSYQLDYRNPEEALRKIKQDIDEGTDIAMVKPSLAYLDIIYQAKQKFNIPVAAYNVSGEYSMVKAYCEKIKNRNERRKTEKKLVIEILTSIKRAGADFIITYWAKDAAKWLK